MTLTRRSFLSGAIALASYALAPKIIRVPRIVGDGQHDDAPGLNALFAGEPVEMDGLEGIINGVGRIMGGRFLLGSPLILDQRASNIMIENAWFGAAHESGMGIRFQDGVENVVMNRCRIQDMRPNVGDTDLIVSNDRLGGWRFMITGTYGPEA